MEEEKVVYLDKEGNLTDEDHAYRMIIQVFRDGEMIQEIISAPLKR